MDDLIKRYKDNIPINFENLGVITDQRNILAQVLYTKNRIYKNPYKLTQLSHIHPNKSTNLS